MTEPLWTPSADVVARCRLTEFMAWMAERVDRSFSDYDDLWQWSVGEGLEEFWDGIWSYFDIVSTTPYDRVLDKRSMPGAQWFEGATINYAEHICRHHADRADDVAIVGISQTRERVELTWHDLVDSVARARAGLVRLGVGPGDRVAAYLPHIPETIVAFLATASLGAIWTSCAPEFGVQAVLDRFRQVEPKVLLAVDGYRYGRHDVSRVEELAAIRAGLPTLGHTVFVPYAADSDGPPDAVAWGDLIGRHGDLAFDRVAPDHPLYVLYSSGTTGLPKPIVHGHGGILLEHLKVLGLHADMRPDDTFFWFTTTGWMMWNYVVSGLLLGARLVTFDGDPNHAGSDTLWRLAADERITWFGGGAPYFSACRRAGLRPASDHDLTAVRAIGSTGAPLPPEAFDWIYESVAPDALLSPISGGTDVCSAFVGGSPLTPVWRGEIPCRYLGAAVAAFDEDGSEVVGREGELVITAPMPSMPVGFWGDDDDGSRYSEAYFEHYPGIWRHGDWITITDRGSCVISGRSDATLNRGGVRVGTAEIYRIVEAVDGVEDSLVVHLESPGDDPGELLLFVALSAGTDLDDELVAAVRHALRTGLSPRHVPDQVVQIRSVPTTLSGKKLELPVKRVLLGADPETAASRGALKDPAAFDEVISVARSLRR